MVAQNIAFGIIAAAMVIAAIRVVTTNNVVHAALYLVVVLGGAAAQYILLAAEFVAVTQVLVYIGAIVVLFLFGIMLTRARIGRADDLNNRQWPVALLVALVLAGRSATCSSTPSATTSCRRTPPSRPTQQVSDTIFSTYLIPFEVLSVLLLAALDRGHRVGPEGLSRPC